MSEEEVKENIKRLFINLTSRYKKIKSINVGYDMETGQNVIFGKVMLTDKENEFMKQYLEVKENKEE